MGSAPLKYCGGCKKQRPHSDFSKNRRTSDGLTVQCKECYRAYHIKRMADPVYVARKRANKARWYRDNPDKVKSWSASAAEWKRDNPERQSSYYHKRKAAKLGSTGQFTGEDVQRRFDWQHGKCAICAISIASGYHVDHIEPLSRGGTNEARNIQLLCAPCNLKKHAQDPIDFMQSVGRLL